MKEATKSKLITLGILIAIGIIVAMSLTSKGPELTDVEVAKCIGEKATLYVQLGCPHCEEQKDMFGDNLGYIRVVDCFYSKDECQENGITSIPTWKIGNKYSQGVQSIKTLRTLTEC